VILEITTPFQCFGELLVVALEIGLELTFCFHHIELNHFYHEFHLLLAQIWIVGLSLNWIVVNYCSLLLHGTATQRCGTAAGAASASFGAATT
jgi:hypothetical protein